MIWIVKLGCSLGSLDVAYHNYEVVLYQSPLKLLTANNINKHHRGYNCVMLILMKIKKCVYKQLFVVNHISVFKSIHCLTLYSMDIAFIPCATSLYPDHIHAIWWRSTLNTFRFIRLFLAKKRDPDQTTFRCKLI